MTETEIELVRAAGDRSIYSLGDIGTVRLEGLFSSRGIAQANGHTWRFASTGFWQRMIEATDAQGEVVGTFAPRDIRRGGTLRWDGHELTLRPVSSLRERYALSEGDRELVLVEGKGWGRRPVKLTVVEPGAIDPGLLLFAAFVVHKLAVDAGSTAGSIAAVSASSAG